MVASNILIFAITGLGMQLTQSVLHFLIFLLQSRLQIFLLNHFHLLKFNFVKKLWAFNSDFILYFYYTLWTLPYSFLPWRHVRSGGAVKTASTVSKLFQNVPEHSSMFWTFVSDSCHFPLFIDVSCHCSSFFDDSCHCYCSLMTAVILIVLVLIVLQIHI